MYVLKMLLKLKGRRFKKV